MLEGILDAGRYGSMLRRLTEDHLGTTLHYYFDIPLGETVARHATRRTEFTPEQMREWYRERDLLPGIDQRIVDCTSSLEQTVDRILSDLGPR